MHEVGEVGEAGVEGDVGDARVGVAEEGGGAAEAGGDEVAVRRGADEGAEGAREVERAGADERGEIAEGPRLVRTGVEGVERGADLVLVGARGGASPGWGGAAGLEDGLDDRDGGMVEICRPMVKFCVDARNGGQDGAGEEAAVAAQVERPADVLDELLGDVDRRAVVAGGVRVAALELGAVAADHDPAGAELAAGARRVARVVGEAPVADERDRPAGVALGVGAVAGTEAAVDVEELCARGARELDGDGPHEVYATTASRLLPSGSSTKAA